jgi:hypothetical protein
MTRPVLGIGSSACPSYNCKENGKKVSNKGVRNRGPRCRRLDAMAAWAALLGKSGKREAHPTKKMEAQD